MSDTESVDAPRRLRYRNGEPDGAVSVVTWSMQEEEERTRMVVEQELVVACDAAPFTWMARDA